MKYQHPTVQIQSPAPGHFVISGHAPTSVFVEEVGHVVPPSECYVPPQVPSGALIAILEERGDFQAPAVEEVDPEELAGRLYETYCEAVGGKAFNGDALPSWDEFRADESKKTQSDAWVLVAIEAGAKHAETAPANKPRGRGRKASGNNGGAN